MSFLNNDDSLRDDEIGLEFKFRKAFVDRIGTGNLTAISASGDVEVSEIGAWAGCRATVAEVTGEVEFEDLAPGSIAGWLSLRGHGSGDCLACGFEVDADF